MYHEPRTYVLNSVTSDARYRRVGVPILVDMGRTFVLHAVHVVQFRQEFPILFSSLNAQLPAPQGWSICRATMLRQKVGQEQDNYNQ